MKVPLISFVVPCFNKQNEVMACLESILRLDSFLWELVFIDDKSDDGSFEQALQIFNSYQGEGMIRVYQSRRNRGVSCTRNIGCRIARGQYVHYLDADDQLEQSYREIELILGKYPIDILMVKVKRMHSQSNRPKRLPPTLHKVKDNVSEGLYRVHNTTKMWEYYLTISGSQSIVKRSVAVSSRFPIGETVFEDFAYYFELNKQVNLNWFYLDRTFVLYNDQPVYSLSRTSKTIVGLQLPLAITVAPSVKIKKKLKSIWFLNAVMTLKKADLLLFFKKEFFKCISIAGFKYMLFALFMLIRRIMV